MRPNLFINISGNSSMQRYEIAEKIKACLKEEGFGEVIIRSSGVEEPCWDGLLEDESVQITVENNE